MLNIPRRYSHFVFGTIQSGLTSLIAAGVASAPFVKQGVFIQNWLGSWIISWIAMLPLVLLAAPQIRRITHSLTREEIDQSR